MNLFLLGGLSALGIVLMLGLLHLINVLQRTPSKGGPLVGRPAKSLTDFARQADDMHVSLRVARETYDLLIEHYPTPMCIDPQDELRRDLDLSEVEIRNVRSSILKKTDRLQSEDSDVSKIMTVGHLLTQVEMAHREKVDRAALRLRAGDCPYPVRPVVEVIEFKATSEIIDPDYLRRQHFRWLRRRLSDYKGLLSRATDIAPKPEHAGPFRRSHEGRREPTTIPSQQNAPNKRAADRVPEPVRRRSEEAKNVDSPQPVTKYPPPAIRVAGPEYPSRS